MNNMPYNYRNNMPYNYRNNMSYNNNRLIGGGFLGPFLLGGLAGGLVSPYFYGGYRPYPYYPPYGGYYYGGYYR